MKSKLKSISETFIIAIGLAMMIVGVSALVHYGWGLVK